MRDTQQSNLEMIKEKTLIVSFFFFLYVVVYLVSKNFGMANAIKTSQGIIFLPAGVRLLACLVGRGWGALGVGMGTWLVVSPEAFPDQNQEFWFSVAFINSTSVLLSVLVMQRVFGIEENLSNLKFLHLPFIDLVATSSQAFFYYCFLYSANVVSEADLIPKFISQVTGNFLGGMIFMLALMVIFKLNDKNKSVS